MLMAVFCLSTVLCQKLAGSMLTRAASHVCCAMICCVQTTREAALRKSEERAERQRNEQDALGMLLTEREAAVLDKEQALHKSIR